MGKTALRREFPTSAVRDRARGGILNFRGEMMLAGAGGPGALLTSSQTGKTVPKREIPTSAVRGRERGGILNFRGEMLFAGAGGRAPSRPLRMGGDGTGVGISDFCGARSGERRNANFREG